MGKLNLKINNFKKHKTLKTHHLALGTHKSPTIPAPTRESMGGKSPQTGFCLPQYRHSNTHPPTPRPPPRPPTQAFGFPHRPPAMPIPPLTRRGLGRGPGPRSLSSPPEGWVRGSGTPAVMTARGWGYGERVQPGAAAPRRPRFAPPRLFGWTQREKRWSVGPRPAGRQRPERRGSRSAPGPG